LPNNHSATGRHFRFGPYDRITISSAHYRAIDDHESDTNGGMHKLQLVSRKLLDPFFADVSDDELEEFERKDNLRVEPGYFSKAHAELRNMTDGSFLMDLSEQELRTIAWKTEWCELFERSLSDADYPRRLNLSAASLADFIAMERGAMDRWYRKKFSERRGLGRPVIPDTPETGDLGDIKVRKEFDYPSPSALRNWINRFRRSGGRSEAFRPQYAKSGRRKHLVPETEAIVATCVDQYLTLNRLTGADIFDSVEVELAKANRLRLGKPALNVSRSTVYRRIKGLNPFLIEVARQGGDVARRKYTMVGYGHGEIMPMARVEMDDWEADLFVLAEKSSVWKKLTPAQRAKVPRVRCTITVAIDCVTRCVVGLNVSPHAPSTPAVRATISTIINSKQALTNFAETRSDWPMRGVPRKISTDGGPVFKGQEIEYTLAQCGVEKNIPEQDPRKRGTIESFFKTLKRICRRFAGQSFKDVIERGEYPGEAMASLCFEQFHKAVIKFIVDRYHHHRHRGLEYVTPYAAWTRDVSTTSPVPSRAQQIVAFGMPMHGVTLDKHGLQYLDIPYSSADLGYLMRLVGSGAKLDFVVNPNDLTSILVFVEDRYRGEMTRRAPTKMFHDYLEVDTPIKDFHGVSLDRYLEGKKVVRAFVAKAQKEGETFRVSANADLYEMGHQALLDARLPTHQLTIDQANRIASQIDWGAQAAFSQGVESPPWVDLESDSYGEILDDGPTGHQSATQQRHEAAPPAHAPEQKKSKPFSRSANLPDDDE